MTPERPDFMDWLEAWLNGYNAARAGVPSDERVLVAARQGFDTCGSRQARELADVLAAAEQEPTGGER